MKLFVIILATLFIISLVVCRLTQTTKTTCPSNTTYKRRTAFFKVNILKVFSSEFFIDESNSDKPTT